MIIITLVRKHATRLVQKRAECVEFAVQRFS